MFFFCFDNIPDGWWDQKTHACSTHSYPVANCRSI
jgi:hypothetical protein